MQEVVMAKADQGIHKTERGEEQPKDKSRAQEAHTTNPENSASHEGRPMDQWKYQIRFDVDDFATSEAISEKAPAFAPLFEVLARHRAVAKCQFVAFADYVRAAEEGGSENFPLYEWTKATIENPSKKEKYLKSFTVYVDDQEVYDGDIADGLESDLRSLPSGLIGRVTKYDTNPANNPQPPKR
jgi:hypothetical protein